MKKINNRLIHAFLLLFILFGCNHTTSNNNAELSRSDSTNMNNKVLRGDDQNVVRERDIQPYRGVDSLLRRLDQHFNFGDISKLDSICKKSDGDLSEKCFEVSRKLLEHHLADFVNYLMDHPNTCLKKVLILGYSEEFVVYQGKDRLKQIAEEKEKLLLKAEEERLSDSQKQVIEEIFNKIDPSLYD